MKIKTSTRARETGSILIVALGLTVLFALILGSYLTMVQGQADSVSRSQGYNMAIPVAEAGAEEAMALLNMNGGVSTWTNNIAANGWSALGSNNSTTKSNLVYGGSYYQVTISNVSGIQPTIYSVGVVPYNEHSWGILMDTNNVVSGTTVALLRTIKVPVSQGSQSKFTYAAAAQGSISFSGGASIDSFNSVNTNYSVGGQYSSTKRDSQAQVGTSSTSSSAIQSSGGVSIRGYINTGPSGAESGTISVGDNAWVAGASNGVESGHSFNNFSMSFPSISAPTATYVETPSSGILGSSNYTLIFKGDQYWGSSNVLYQSSLNLSGSQIALVTNGNVTIYVPSADTLNFSGSSGIYVAPGSSLTIYCGASSATISGSAFMEPTNAEQVIMYGLPTLTSINYSGGSGFMGAIYAPQAAFNGSGSMNITGAIVANSLTFSGSATIHYDENLATYGASNFTASGWQEIATPLAYQGLVP